MKKKSPQQKIIDEKLFKYEKNIGIVEKKLMKNSSNMKKLSAQQKKIFAEKVSVFGRVHWILKYAEFLGLFEDLLFAVYESSKCQVIIFSSFLFYINTRSIFFLEDFTKFWCIRSLRISLTLIPPGGGWNPPPPVVFDLNDQLIVDLEN